MSKKRKNEEVVSEEEQEVKEQGAEEQEEIDERNPEEDSFFVMMKASDMFHHAGGVSIITLLILFCAFIFVCASGSVSEFVVPFVFGFLGVLIALFFFLAMEKMTYAFALKESEERDRRRQDK